ncbi:MAG TPA: ornithine cyclodeaminase family protein [Actinomycetota bacterium]|nr:ornithine cyclodeaminase family protein [Actinomycetota bacterium]
MLVLRRGDVEASLDIDRLIAALRDTFRDVSAGKTSSPPRTAALVPDRAGYLGVMPAFVPSLGVLETKLVSLFPQNRDRPTHQAVIVVFDPTNGTPTALLDAEYITAVRTAAGSAVATDLLARREASVLAIVGTGVQAASHARVVTRVRSFDRILLAGRDADKALALRDRLSSELSVSVEVADAESATRDADVVCATTHSPDPVVPRSWLRPGTHVNSVGVHPTGGELDRDTIRDGVVVVESRAAALAPPPAGANELLGPLDEGVMQEADIAELGEVLAGARPGRASEDDLTVYKSVGIGPEDAAAAAIVLEAAGKQGLGVDVSLA